MTDLFDDALGAPEALKRAPLSMVVARRLREAIVSGDLPDGTPLPSEKELTQRLGVGRSTVREALRVLQAQGLVSGGDSTSTRTPTVARSGVLPSAALALQNVLLLNLVPLGDLVALRRVIEQAGLRAAAARRDPEALARARDMLDRMRASTHDAEAFHQADVDFHAALIDAADNQAYSLVMRVLRGAMARHLRRALSEAPALPGLASRLVAEHQALLDAVSRGDGADAAARVDVHIASFYEGRR